MSRIRIASPNLREEISNGLCGTVPKGEGKGEGG